MVTKVIVERATKSKKKKKSFLINEKTYYTIWNNPSMKHSVG